MTLSAECFAEDMRGIASASASRQDTVAGIAALTEARTVLEVGVWKGESSAGSLGRCRAGLTCMSAFRARSSKDPRA